MLRLALVALALLFVGSIADVPAMFLAVRGELPLAFIFIAGFLADILPDFFWYWLGGKIGLERITKIRFRFLRQEERRVKKADKAFHRYGGFILFFSKFVYLFGIPTQIVAGAHRYDLRKMFIANALGAAGWLALLYSLARTFEKVSIVEDYIKDVKIAFLLFFIIAFLIHYLIGRPLARVFNRD